MKKPPSARTENGAPWVRWAGKGGGWVAPGSRDPNQLGKNVPFWTACVGLAAIARECTLDHCQSGGDGLLALGALGVTARSGYAQRLLWHCLHVDPERFAEIMTRPMSSSAPVYLSSQGFRFAADGEGWREKDIVDGHRLASLIGCQESTTTSSKKRARLWVERCSMLFRDQRMDEAQAMLAEEVLAAESLDVLALVDWPGPDGAKVWWQWTKEQQALWALAMVVPLGLEGNGVRLVDEACERFDTAEDRLRSLMGMLRARGASRLNRAAKRYFQIH